MGGLGSWLLYLLNLAGGAPPVDDSAPCPCFHVTIAPCAFTSRIAQTSRFYRSIAPIPALASAASPIPAWRRVIVCEC